MASCFNIHIKRILRTTVCVVAIQMIFPFQGSGVSPDKNERPTVGLVLSGGAAKGLAHIGVLKVIDSLNIPVDYIGGTSMGSVIGGLYSAGYSAKQIESFALSQDWNMLFGNQINRRNLAIREKKEEDRYIASLPIENKRIKLPKGLSSGQNILDLLTRLFWPYHHISDFDELPIPFFCIATDIITGNEVVLDTGYLPDAIMASSAIPTIFTPIEKDKKMLVDGGVVNNFPVEHMEERGVDIIIGVNLGFRWYDSDELASFTKILEQSLFIHTYENSKKNEELCDILISPQLKNLNAASFDEVKTFIKRGERAALSKLDSFNILTSTTIQGNICMTDSLRKSPKKRYYITDLQLTGIEHVSKRFIRGKLRLQIPSFVTPNDMKYAIDRLYGTQFFDRVTYRFVPNEAGKRLIVSFKEKPNQLLQVGAHYNSDFQSSLLFNLTFRNFLLKGSKFSTDFAISKFPRFKTEYLLFTGWKPRKKEIFNEQRGLKWYPDLGISFSFQALEIYDYQEGDKIGYYDYRQTLLDVFGINNVQNILSISYGLKAHFSAIKGKIISDPAFADYHNQMGRAYISLEYDTYDKAAYPTAGAQAKGYFEYARNFDVHNIIHSNIFRGFFEYKQVISLSERFTLIPRIYSGIAVGPKIPPDFEIYFGGLNEFEYSNIIFPFTGLEFLEVSNNCALVYATDLRYKLLEDHYLTLTSNLGKAASEYTGLFQDFNVYAGTGLTYGYNSFFGPVEVTAMTGTHKGILFYLSIGHRF